MDTGFKYGWKITGIWIGLITVLNAQSTVQISTADVARFWTAYDRLSLAHTHEDSLAIIEQTYLSAASPGFKKLIRHGNFTAEEYVTLIGLYPRFWPSIRAQTLNIAARAGEIQRTLSLLQDSLPGFILPDLCFAIGCLRVGGTVAKQTLLISAELADPGSAVDMAELPQWRRQIIGQSQGLLAYVAHESMHVQQKGFPVLELFSLLKHHKLNLLNMAIIEGSADFLTHKFAHLNINAPLQIYAHERECTLWQEFKTAMTQRPFDYTPWLYNYRQALTRPPDLAYYLGFKITEQYLARSKNQQKAIKKLWRRGQYKSVFRRSGYTGHCGE